MRARSIIADTFRFLLGNRQLVLLWSAVFLALSMVMIFTTRPMLAQFPHFQPGVPPALLLRTLVLNLITMAVMVVLVAAAMRAVLRPEDSAPGKMRLSLDEVRLVGLGLIVTIGCYLAVLIAFAIVMLLAVGLGLLAKPLGVAIGIILGIPVLLAPIYVLTRLSLAGPLTLLRGKIIIGDAWRLSAGAFWPLFRLYLIIGIVTFLLVVVAMLLFTPEVFQLYLHPFDPKRIAALQARSTEAGPSPWLLLNAVVGALTGGVMTALQGGSVALAAQELLAARRLDQEA